MEGSRNRAAQAWSAGENPVSAPTVDAAAATEQHPHRSPLARWIRRLAVPIIGHTWGGSTANETTNISGITTAISALSTDMTDAFLMLHRVQPTTTADGSMSSIGIRKGDLETIAAAIKTGIDAGTLEAVTMPELAISGGGFWGNF